MSSDRDTTASGQQSQTMTPTPTAEETEYNKLMLDREKFLDPQIRQTQGQGLDLVSQLLAGKELPGYLKGLPGGISEEVTGSIVDQSLTDLNTQLAKSGAGTFMESGASQAIGTRTAADVRNQAAQFNLGNLQQLLNIGVGGQAQVQAPIAAFSGQLSSRLAGLRTVQSTGTSSSQQQFTYNPFKESFYSSLGSSLGSRTGNLGSTK